MTRILVVTILVLGALLLGALLSGDGFNAISSGQASMQSIILMSGYLLLVSGGLITGIKTQGMAVLRYAVIWLAIGCLIALFYRVLH